MKIDVEGNIVWKPDTDYGIDSGYVIHGAIHMARPEVKCVLHTHTRAGMAVAAMKCGLLPLSQTLEDPLCRPHRLSRLRRPGGRSRRTRAHRTILAAQNALVMRNHGLLTCGETVQQAFNTMYQLEMSCRSQVNSMAARTELTMPGENVLAHTAHLYQPGTRRPYGVLEWPAMLRLLDAQQKTSGYPPHRH